MPITFGSLFAGIGGIDLGFERAGMECRWQVEIDDYANRVLAKHWPGVPRYRDIRECGAHNLEWVNIVCGGFPCQDISYAGLGAGLDGERSGLFFEAVRVVQELRPDGVVLENVAALLTRGLDRVLGTLAEIGYDAEWHCIPAAAVGAPHIRDRVFVCAYANSGRLSQQQKRDSWTQGRRRASSRRDPVRFGDDVSYTDFIQYQSNSPEIGRSTTAKLLADATSVRRKEGRHESPNNGQQSAQGERRMLQPGRSDWWATEPDVGRVADGIPARVDRLRGLGNAVVPQVAEFIGRRVVEACTTAARSTTGPMPS